MNLKNALLHNTGWKLFAMLFTFANNILIVRILGIEASSALFYALAIFTLVSTVLRFGLENGIIYYTAKYPERLSPILFFMIILSFLQALICYYVLKYFVPQSISFTFLWVIVYVMANVFLYYINSFYQVKKMFVSVNVISVFVTFFQTVLLVYILNNKKLLVNYSFAKSNVDLFFIIMSAILAIQIVALFIYFINKNNIDFSILTPNKVTVNNLFSYSFINFISSVLLFLIMRGDLYFVEKYCSTKVLGNYLQAAKIAQLLLIIPGLIGGVIFPYSVNNADVLSTKVAFLSRMLTLIYVAAFFLILIIGSFIFPFLLGKDFNLMQPILLSSFIGIYCLSINILFIAYFEGINKQKVILLSSAIALITLLTLDYFLVPIYGYISAALVFSLANAVGLFFMLNYFKNKVKLTFIDLFIFKKSDFLYFKKLFLKQY